MAEITKEQQEQLDNFNWTKYEQGIDQVDQDKLNEFERLVKDNFVDTQADELTLLTAKLLLTSMQKVKELSPSMNSATILT